MEPKRTFVRQFKMLTLSFSGALAGTAVGMPLLFLTKAWWDQERWLDFAWVQAAFLLVALSGMMAGAELGIRWVGYRTAAPATKRLWFRAMFVLGMVIWFAPSKQLLWPREPWGFWSPLVLGLVSGGALQSLGVKQGIVTLVDAEEGS